MTSHDITRYLHAYCDGELQASKMLDVEGHLESCPSCREAVEAAQVFREGLRAKIPREPVPPHLAEGLRARIAEEEHAARPARARLWGRRTRSLELAASIALLTLGGVLGYLVAQHGSIPGVHPLVMEVALEHMRFAPLENPVELSSPNTEQIAFWVEERTGHPVRVPDYSSSGIQLLGGRVTTLGGRRAAYIMYEKGRNILSLFAFPAYEASLDGLKEIRKNGRTFLTGEHQGKQTVFWKSGTMTYALVSNVGWDELFQCAKMFFEGVPS